MYKLSRSSHSATRSDIPGEIDIIQYHCERNKQSMKIIVISEERDLPGEPEMVNKLFAAGLDLFHLRKPAYGQPEYASFISLIDGRFHRKLVIHGSYQLYAERQLGGIHLNTAARRSQDVWSRVAGIPHSAISASFHSWEEILENDFRYGSVFISPLFDSISKPGYKGSIDIAAITKVRNVLTSENKYCPEIIALGGVDKSGIPALLQHGYDGAALLGAIWNAADPVAAFREIRALTK